MRRKELGTLICMAVLHATTGCRRETPTSSSVRIDQTSEAIIMPILATRDGVFTVPKEFEAVSETIRESTLYMFGESGIFTGVVVENAGGIVIIATSRHGIYHHGVDGSQNEQATTYLKFRLNALDQTTYEINNFVLSESPRHDIVLIGFKVDQLEADFWFPGVAVNETEPNVGEAGLTFGHGAISLSNGFPEGHFEVAPIITNRDNTFSRSYMANIPVVSKGDSGEGWFTVGADGKAELRGIVTDIEFADKGTRIVTAISPISGYSTMREEILKILQR
ncbi:MAG: hypothetical protein WAU07_00560 [Microgenomates group bacterium]